MTGTAYIIYEDIPLDSFGEDGPPLPAITDDMVIEAARIAYGSGDDAGAEGMIRAFVDALKPTSAEAAESIAQQIMDVCRSAPIFI